MPHLLAPAVLCCAVLCCAVLCCAPVAGWLAGQLNVLLSDTKPHSTVGMESEAVYAGVYDESTRDYSPYLALPTALAILR